MNLIIIDSFNVGGIEKRYLSIVEYLIKNKKDKNFYFLINRAAIKNKRLISFFLENNNVKIYGFFNLFSKIPFLRLIEYRILLLLTFIQILFFNKQKFDLTFFIGRNSLRFVKIINTKQRIYELVYSGKLNDKIEYTDVFALTKSFQFHFLCLTESIYNNINLLIKNNLHPYSTIKYSNKSFLNSSVETDKIDINKKTKTVTFVSRLDFGKGVHLLVDIINDTMKMDNTINFNIIGYGKFRNYISECLNELNKKYNVNLKVLNTTETSHYLKTSLLFLSLQEYENFPSQSALEALFHENYLLATDVGMSSLLVKYNNGELLESKAQTFADRIVGLCEDFENTQRLGRKSKELVVNEFNIEDYIIFLDNNYKIFK